MSRKVKKIQYDIAGRLLLLRVRLYGNASEMARSVNVTPQSWYNYETGRRALDAFVAAKIVEAHGVDFNWLFTGGRMTRMKPKIRKLLASGGPVIKPARRKQRAKPLPGGAHVK